MAAQRKLSSTDNIPSFSRRQRRAAGHAARVQQTLASVTGLALCAAWPGFALAQSVLPEIKVSGEADSAYVEKKSSTATRTDTALRDTPQSISVVTEAQVRDQAAQSIQEALRYVPGVGFAQGEGNRETPIFRGISSTGDFFIDGIRDDVQYYRDLYNIERVEVFRGPNAMIFGRGATGGLINRVSRTPSWVKSFGASLTYGSWDNRRATFDLNQPLSADVAMRLDGMYENSNSYRDGVSIERSGINPTLAWRLSPRTMVTVGYEYFKDQRTADRGITSYLGAPVATGRSTFFGNADASPTGTTLNAATALIEHTFDDGTVLRNRSRYADQDKFYQNVFPGAVNAAGNAVALAAYNNATSRESWFNQTDLVFNASTGAVKHKLLAGAEFGQQDTSNFRNTGFFNGAASINVPLSNPFTAIPVSFSQSATDANNSGRAKVAALYLQDQIELSPQFQVVAGVRYDQFKVDFTNNRNGQQFNTTDNLVSPRVGVIYRPVEPLSLYANYSIAYQPRAGDQLASLTLSTAALDPEKFKNYEIGAKWDVSRNLSATAALYRLDRSNVVVLDPSDATHTRTMLSDGQRSEGLELSLAGNLTRAWSMIGAYSYTDAKFVADTSATLRAGGRVAQVPKNTFSLWNRYDFNAAVAAAVGVIYRDKSFAANEQIASAAAPLPNVVLPGFTRVDAAFFYKIDKNLQMQVNIENLFDKNYYSYANSNTNITPGSPRAIRVGLVARF